MISEKSDHMNYQPLVSIVIPVFRGEPYLREAIDSCLSQTYPNIEIIVVNDGSDDDGRTDAIARSYGDKIRYYAKENGGVSSALNFGISQMRGEWFSWLSHDDVFLPDKTEKQVNAALALNNPACVVRCTTMAINESGAQVFRPQRKVSGIFSSEQMMKLHSLGEVGLYGCALLIHKDIIDACGGFDEKLRAVQDEDYWNRIMLCGYPFVSLPDVLVKNRVHKAQATLRYRDLFVNEHYIMCERVAQAYRTDPAANKRITEILLYKQCKERRKSCAKLLKTTFSSVSGFSMRRLSGVVFYSMTGTVYAAGKKLYRKIVVGRHR